MIASGAIDGIINLFDVKSGKLLHTLEGMSTIVHVYPSLCVSIGHAMSVRSLCFSPDSQLLVTGSDDKDMKLYDVYGRVIYTVCLYV